MNTFAPRFISQYNNYRMYLGIVLIGVAHGLILLPVLLTFIGPNVSTARIVSPKKMTNKTVLVSEQSKAN